MTQARILVVDDGLTNIELIADIFGDDYEVLFATEGEKALEIAATENPELILLDVMMPGMDGYEVCRRLKAKHLTEKIPVIFITALGDEEAESRGLESGAVDYVTKPFLPSVRHQNEGEEPDRTQACAGGIDSTGHHRWADGAGEPPSLRRCAGAGI